MDMGSTSIGGESKLYWCIMPWHGDCVKKLKKRVKETKTAIAMFAL